MRHKTVYKTVEVEVEIDALELLDDLDDNELTDYLKKRAGFENTDPFVIEDYDELVNTYYHGDFDLEKFLSKLRKKDVVKILEKFKGTN